MESKELSIKKLKRINKKLYSKVKKKYNYDLVIFIAKGAYLIGRDLAQYNKVPFIEVKATRSGGKIKNVLSPILKIMPEKFKNILREVELNSNIHSANKERKISYNKTIWKNYINCKKILIVDDSIDTGYSIINVKNEVQKFFNKSEAKIAVLNYFEKAKDIIIPDYYLYKNTILKGPWSNDSKDNKEFLSMYNDWKEE